MAVLSIQSHVVYGHAGNSAAVFPLQRLGNEVWDVNTVDFSNHTGYGAWRGKIHSAEYISELIKGLEERDVFKNCEAVLSGYLGDASSGAVIAETVKKIKNNNAKALYCCDPVMGDTGRGLYVKPDIPIIFKNELVRLADIVTPNQFELEELTGIKTPDINTALAAVDILHEKGPSVVLVTSFREKEGEITMLASCKNKVYKITTPLIPLGNDVAGTGDMTSAVFLSYYLKTGDIKETLELCTSSVYGVLKISYNEFKYKGDSSPAELKLVKAQQELHSPSKKFQSVKIKG